MSSYAKQRIKACKGSDNKESHIVGIDLSHKILTSPLNKQSANKRTMADNDNLVMRVAVTAQVRQESSLQSAVGLLVILLLQFFDEVNKLYETVIAFMWYSPIITFPNYCRPPSFCNTLFGFTVCLTAIITIFQDSTSYTGDRYVTLSTLCKHPLCQSLNRSDVVPAFWVSGINICTEASLSPSAIHITGTDSSAHLENHQVLAESALRSLLYTSQIIPFMTQRQTETYDGMWRLSDELATGALSTVQLNHLLFLNSALSYIFSGLIWFIRIIFYDIPYTVRHFQWALEPSTLCGLAALRCVILTTFSPSSHTKRNSHGNKTYYQYFLCWTKSLLFSGIVLCVTYCTILIMSLVTSNVMAAVLKVCFSSPRQALVCP
eukprot:Tbor_TRINITY_DN5787_c0_g1::TRINITY_DN5787_c0_g1_i1::g.20853::m.20853